MNKTFGSLAATTAATAALALIPLAAIAGPASAATAAPDPGATPVAFTGGDSQAYYQAGSTSPVVQLTTDGEARQTVLMPDGQNVIVSHMTVGTASGTDVLYRINIATKTVTQIPQSGPPTDAASTLAPLAVSPDGSAVAGLAWAEAVGGSGIYVQKTDGTPAYLISPGNDVDRPVPEPRQGIAWSHDGRFIAWPAVGTDAAGWWEGIVYAPAGGGGPQTVVFKDRTPGTSCGGYEGLAWTPDDRGLLSTRQCDGTSLLYADVATGAVTPVMTDPGRQIWDVAVDQHWDVFVETFDPAGDKHHHRIDAAWLGNPAAITTVADDAGYPSVSTAGPADPRPANLPAPGSAPTPTPTPTPTPPPPPPAKADPKVIVFGVRGSRDGNHPDTSVDDDVIRQFDTELGKRLPAGSVLYVPVPYTAIPVHILLANGKVDPQLISYLSHDYRASVDDGISQLLLLESAYAKKYPHAYLGFVGYSQGEQVIREAFRQMTKTRAEQARIAFSVGYGDPLFSEQQPAINQGVWRPGLRGIYYLSPAVPDVRIPAALVPRTEDWCRYGDIVANWSLANFRQYGETMHVTGYAGTDYIPRGASFAAQAMTRLQGYGSEVNRYGNGFDVYRQRQAVNTPIVSWAVTQGAPATHFLRKPGALPGAYRFEYAPDGTGTGLYVSDPGFDAAGTGQKDGLVLRAASTGPWQQWYPQPDGTLKNAATGLVVSPNGTGSQLRGTASASPWGGSAYTWTDYAFLPS